MSTIYTPDQAAHECLNASIVQLSFSRPRKGIDEAKARLRHITIKGKAAYQLTVKNKQAFQKTIEPEAVSGTIAECFSRFKAAECRGQKEQLFFPEGTPLAFLIEQGVMNAEGAVLKQKYHKFRQINKFLEFIAGIEPFIRDTVARSGKPFPITDFGCGKD